MMTESAADKRVNRYLSSNDNLCRMILRYNLARKGVMTDNYSLAMRLTVAHP